MTGLQSINSLVCSHLVSHDCHLLDSGLSFRAAALHISYLIYGGLSKFVTSPDRVQIAAYILTKWHCQRCARSASSPSCSYCRHECRWSDQCITFKMKWTLNDYDYQASSVFIKRYFFYFSNFFKAEYGRLFVMGSGHYDKELCIMSVCAILS